VQGRREEFWCSNILLVTSITTVEKGKKKKRKGRGDPLPYYIYKEEEKSLEKAVRDGSSLSP